LVRHLRSYYLYRLFPRKKRADVFSTAILKLYARDRMTVWVFSLLSMSALLSLLFGTGWVFGVVGEQYILPMQFVLMGASLDAIRVFYTRALDLLVPATALRLVRRECQRSINRARRQIEWIVRLYKLADRSQRDFSMHRCALHAKSGLPKAITIWNNQLEEFAHKGLTRKETQGVSDIVATMAEIAINYTEARRDSLVLKPDFTGIMPVGVGDIGDVINPVCEAIYNIVKDASKQSNEPVVQNCFYALGNIVTHAMTMVHDAARQRTTPLANSPVYYSQLCVDSVAEAGMVDGLRAAIQVTRRVFDGITVGVDTRAAEATALDVLFKVAMASYTKQSLIGCFESVQMMLRAAHQDIRVKGYRDASSVINAVLPRLPNLVVLEVIMEKSGARMMQTFPPYDMGFESSIPMVLAEVANQVKPVEHGREQRNPYRDFVEASEKVVHHYRAVAELVPFDGALLEKWIIGSIFQCVTVHTYLMDNAQAEAERHISTVEDRLRWFIHAPTFFFKAGGSFQYHHATEACEQLAVLGMGLLQRQRLESANACVDAIAAMARKCAEPQNPARYKPYGFAECLVELEKVARVADVLGKPALAARYRALGRQPENILEQDWPEYEEALQNRTRHMERELEEQGQRFRLRENSMDSLRDIISEHQDQT
jgi:hypothetical protein